MNKKLIAVIFSSLLFTAAMAQKEDDERGFKSDHVFIGSGLNLGFSNGFIIGLNPEFGYSINRVLDAGIAMNLTYVTQRNPNVNITARYLALGGGPFVRIWPIEQLFIGGQFEYNKISYSEKTDAGIINKATANAPSFLVGAGYGIRTIGNMQFYTSIMIDAMKDFNSPYRDQYGRVLPVFRTGFSFYLGRKKNR
jgi:hypothetical protein